MTPERPFYGSFAWAYDHLVDRPIAEEGFAVAGMLAEAGVRAPANVLDAGCGTGRHAAVLTALGYRVLGLDRSPALLAVARAGPAKNGVRLAVADLLALPVRAAWAGILCRGVLNDVLDDAVRGAVLRGFADALRAGGALILDVRDWDATVRSKTAQPVHERTVDTGRGRLTFRSETRLDAVTRRLLISERHALTAGGRATTETYEFVMRCWTPDELRGRLSDAGFEIVQLRPGYTEPAARPDRLVVIARRRSG
jgi:SAM-dependent methyltransferase